MAFPREKCISVFQSGTPSSHPRSVTLSPLLYQTREHTLPSNLGFSVTSGSIVEKTRLVDYRHTGPSIVR